MIVHVDGEQYAILSFAIHHTKDLGPVVHEIILHDTSFAALRHVYDPGAVKNLLSSLVALDRIIIDISESASSLPEKEKQAEWVGACPLGLRRGIIFTQGSKFCMLI